MQVTISIDGVLLRRTALCALTLAGVMALSRAHAGSVTIPNAFTGGTTISASQMNANFAAVKAAVDDNDARIATLEAQVAALTDLLQGVSRPDASTLVFTGMNVQLVNGAAGTSTADGTGNLILGHNTNSLSRQRTGSHNIVVGDDHGYTGVAGLIVGYQHQASGEGACVLGGTLNEAGDGAAVLGGRMNRAVAGDALGGPFGSVIVGGRSNLVSGVDSVIVGGEGGEIDDADPNVADADEGFLATMIGGHPSNGAQQGDAFMSEDRGVYIATNATGVGLGAWADLVEVGHNYGFYMGIGNGFGRTASAPIEVGANQPQLNLESVNIKVGTEAAPAFGVLQATQSVSICDVENANINMGNAAGVNVNIGDGAGAVYVGQNATTVGVAPNTP